MGYLSAPANTGSMYSWLIRHNDYGLTNIRANTPDLHGLPLPGPRLASYYNSRPKLKTFIAAISAHCNLDVQAYRLGVQHHNYCSSCQNIDIVESYFMSMPCRGTTVEIFGSSLPWKHIGYFHRVYWMNKILCEQLQLDFLGLIRSIFIFSLSCFLIQSPA